MRIEEGKHYRTRDGRKVGPMALFGPLWGTGDEPRGWYEDGRRSVIVEDPRDLISEWTDEGPVRTVTRQEITPGTYDGVVVMANLDPYSVNVAIIPTHMNADELERAAAVLTALAGALRDGR